MGVQVHGGMGYIEETGAAQHFRDARITPIYEGTNGIQAIDLAGRKLSMQDGLLFEEILDEIKACIAGCQQNKDERLQQAGKNLSLAADAMEQAVSWLLDPAQSKQDVLSAANAFQDMCAITIGGFYLIKGALAAQEMLKRGAGDKAYYQGRVDLAVIFASSDFALAAARISEIRAGADCLYALGAEELNP